MGATLDIQRQQRMDMLDQQLLLAQYNEARRNTRQQPQVGDNNRCCTLYLSIWTEYLILPLYVCVCAVWVVSVDQVVPLPETERTKPTSNAAPPPGSDTPVHTAAITRQFSCRRGAGGCSYAFIPCPFTGNF